MYNFPLSTVVVAACGGVYKSDPTPNPSPREGLSATKRQN